MGKAFNIRRDIAHARPCRACGQPVFLVRVNYRVVPDAGAEIFDLVSMPTRMNMVLEQAPDDEGYYVINAEPNGRVTEGFVAYDPERSIDAVEWGFGRYRGHDCPAMTQDKTERAHANRTFSAGRILRWRFDDDDASVGRRAG